MNEIIVVVARYFIFIPLVVGLYVFWKESTLRRKQLLIVGALSCVLAYVIAKLGSAFYYDARPFVVGNFTPLISHAADNGFPSDHTLLAATIAAVITYFNTRAGVALWFVALLIGIARILAGVHHLVDIFGSMLIAAVATYVVITLSKKWFPSTLENTERETN